MRGFLCYRLDGLGWSFLWLHGDMLCNKFDQLMLHFIACLHRQNREYLLLTRARPESRVYPPSVPAGVAKLWRRVCIETRLLNHEERALRFNPAELGRFNFSDLHGWFLPLLPRVRNTPSSQPTSQALFALDIFDVYRPEGSAVLKAGLRRDFRAPVLPLRKYTGGKPARQCKHASRVIYRVRS